VKCDVAVAIRILRNTLNLWRNSLSWKYAFIYKCLTILNISWGLTVQFFSCMNLKTNNISLHYNYSHDPPTLVFITYKLVYSCTTIYNTRSTNTTNKYSPLTRRHTHTRTHHIHIDHVYTYSKQKAGRVSRSLFTSVHLPCWTYRIYIKNSPSHNAKRKIKQH
jgi:hypothetical protein